MSRFFKLGRGFTLVEMMVAIAILAISAMVIYSSNSNAIRHQLTLEESTIGHWLLLNAIEQEKLSRILEPATASNELKSQEINVGEKAYEIVVENLDPDNDHVLMLEFEIFVRDEDTAETHLIDSVTTMLQKIE